MTIPDAPDAAKEPAKAAPPRKASLSEATGAGAAGQPPRLQTHLWQRLKFLALLNILPIAGMSYLAIMYALGKVSIRTNLDGRQTVTIVLILIACLVFAASSWLVMPFARWFRDYPAWHYRHTSRLLWFMPRCAGWLAWFLLWCLCLAAAVYCLFVVGTGLIQLYHALASHA